jgi:hypothetical protein
MSCPLGKVTEFILVTADWLILELLQSMLVS